MRRPSPCSTDVRGVLMADETDRKDDKAPRAEKPNTEGLTERSQANPEVAANALPPGETGRRLKLNFEAFPDLPPLPDLGEVAVIVLREQTLRERIIEGLGLHVASYALWNLLVSAMVGALVFFGLYVVPRRATAMPP